VNRCKKYTLFKVLTREKEEAIKAEEKAKEFVEGEFDFDSYNSQIEKLQQLLIKEDNLE